MDRKFLQELKVEGLENGLPKEVIDEIMKQYGTSVQEKDKQIETLKTEKDGINKQLEDANNKIQSFKDIDVDNLNTQIKEWETKYNQDTENLKNELSKKDYDYKLKDLISTIKFSSNGAKRAFLEYLKNQELKFDDKTLMTKDLVRILGRRYVGVEAVADKAFTLVAKPGVSA